MLQVNTNELRSNTEKIKVTSIKFTTLFLSAALITLGTTFFFISSVQAQEETTVHTPKIDLLSTENTSKTPRTNMALTAERKKVLHEIRAQQQLSRKHIKNYNRTVTLGELQSMSTPPATSSEYIVPQELLLSVPNKRVLNTKIYKAEARTSLAKRNKKRDELHTKRASRIVSREHIRKFNQATTSTELKDRMHRAKNNRIHYSRLTKKAPATTPSLKSEYFLPNLFKGFFKTLTFDFELPKNIK